MKWRSSNQPPDNTYSARTPDEYLRKRIDFKIDAYRTKGDRYRWGHQIVASLSVIAAASVPVLINLTGYQASATLLSLLVTVLVGLEGVFHFREHWKNYDLIKVFLRQEECLFEARGGVYRNKADAEAFVLLVERVEEAIAKERAHTIEMRTSKAPEPSEQGGGTGSGEPKPADAGSGSRGTTTPPP